MTTFYLVRHGETEWNAQKLMQGHQDSPLTEKGLQQAKDLNEKLKNINFEAVFSSDLLRAKRTAEIIILEKKLAIQTSKLIRERSYGKYEGKPGKNFLIENQDLLKKFESLTKKEQWKFKYADDIESNEEVVSRLITFLREIAVAYPEKIILIVTHGGLMRVLLSHLGHELLKGEIGNGAYIKLESDGTDFFIKETDGISPQEKSGSPFLKK